MEDPSEPDVQERMLQPGILPKISMASQEATEIHQYVAENDVKLGLAFAGLHNDLSADVLQHMNNAKLFIALHACWKTILVKAKQEGVSGNTKKQAVRDTLARIQKLKLPKTHLVPSVLEKRLRGC